MDETRIRYVPSLSCAKGASRESQVHFLFETTSSFFGAKKKTLVLFSFLLIFLLENAGAVGYDLDTPTIRIINLPNSSCSNWGYSKAVPNGSAASVSGRIIRLSGCNVG